MKFTHETLMAYADGELDTETRRAIEAAMATDAQLAQEIERHRALRAELREAFGGVLTEPVPQRLIDAAQSSPATGAPIADLAAARAAKARRVERGRWSWREWTSIAASLLIGVLAGRTVLHEPAPGSMLLASSDGRIAAAGTLAAALTERVGGRPSTNDAVQIGVSFRSRSGEYCRTFATAHDNPMAGFACRDADGWRVHALARSEPGERTGDYRMAGTQLSAPIVAAVEDTMTGEALDAEEEAAARERGWLADPSSP